MIWHIEVLPTTNTIILVFLSIVNFFYPDLFSTLGVKAILIFKTDVFQPKSLQQFSDDITDKCFKMIITDSIINTIAIFSFVD